MKRNYFFNRQGHQLVFDLDRVLPIMPAPFYSKAVVAQEFASKEETFSQREVRITSLA